MLSWFSGFCVRKILTVARSFDSQEAQFCASKGRFVQAFPALDRQHNAGDARLRRIERGDMTRQNRLPFLDLYE
jgi:hypothetical protein